MKIPKTFVPEKRLDEKVEDLKSGVDKRLSLKDLILSPEFFDGLMRCDQINDHSLKSIYSFFNLSEIEEIISLEYTLNGSNKDYTLKKSNTLYTVYVNILQFKDKLALEKDFQNIVKKRKKLDVIAYAAALTRSNYAIFVFMFSGDMHFYNELVNVYKSEFGFKEVKEY